MILAFARIVNYNHELCYKQKRNLRSYIYDSKLLQYKPQKIMTETIEALINIQCTIACGISALKVIGFHKKWRRNTINDTCGLYYKPWNTKWGSITVPLTSLIDWFGIGCMTTDNFCFYLQNKLIQTSQTGGQWYSDTSPFSIPCYKPIKIVMTILKVTPQFGTSVQTIIINDSISISSKTYQHIVIYNHNNVYYNCGIVYDCHL